MSRQDPGLWKPDNPGRYWNRIFLDYPGSEAGSSLRTNPDSGLDNLGLEAGQSRTFGRTIQDLIEAGHPWISMEQYCRVIMWYTCVITHASLMMEKSNRFSLANCLHTSYVLRCQVHVCTMHCDQWCLTFVSWNLPSIISTLNLTFWQVPVNTEVHTMHALLNLKYSLFQIDMKYIR